MYRFFVTVLFASILMNGFTQNIEDSININKVNEEAQTIQLSPESASDYINKLIESQDLWRAGSDGVNHNFQRLLDHYNEPFDSVRSSLQAFPYDSIIFTKTAFVSYDTIPLWWLNDSTFIFNQPELDQSPFLIVPHILENEQALDILFRDSLPDMDVLSDSIFSYPDTIYAEVIDSSFLASQNIQLYSRVHDKTIPSVPHAKEHGDVFFLRNKEALVYTDTTYALVAEENSPFYIIPNTAFSDSLESAINTLLSYTLQRDSIPIYINDINGNSTPFYLGTGHDTEYRYWLKNLKNDSITVWIGNPALNTISVALEDDININRMTKTVIDDIPFTLAEPSTKLIENVEFEKIPIYWDYNIAGSFSFNQTYLANWSKGGESALATMLDLMGEATYEDTKNKTKWNSNARIKYGSILGTELGLRKNTDQFEINSQYNKLLKGKFDFTGSLYVKNQLAKGYNYPNDSVPISKFLSPMTFTIGAGVEYKPWKHTQINFSPASYKNTFVRDSTIDETKHGIEEGHRSKQEMGGQLVMKNKLNILKGLEINNSVRLFANYFAKPLNMDVDWEINLKRRITWFFTVSANMHLIYDKDILFPVLDEDDKPMTNPDGSALKEPKIQFMEFVGLSFAINF